MSRNYKFHNAEGIVETYHTKGFVRERGYAQHVQNGTTPSIFSHNVQLYKSLRSANVGRLTSIRAVINATKEQLKNRKMPWHKVPNIRVRRVAYQ